MNEAILSKIGHIQGGIRMLRQKMDRVLTIIFTVLTFALSMASHATSAKDAKAIVTPVAKADMRLATPATLGGTNLQAGEYSITADGAHAKFLKNGKVIAEASVEWKDEGAKPKTTAIFMDGNQIKEIHFGGKMKYVEITQ
jgi:hypothetical protein